MDVKSFIKAARLRTLPLSVSGIIVGSALGYEFAFNEMGNPKLKTLFQLSGGNEIKIKFMGMRRLRVLFTLNRIDKLQGN